MLLPENRRKRTIGLKEIETTIATMARIPPKAVSKDDAEVLRNLEETLKRVIYGQDKAIEALSASIKLARAGLREPEKPIGCYLFSGPTGVGKTEVARQLAVAMGVELIRFDMSEYMERHTVSRLIASRSSPSRLVRVKPYAALAMSEAPALVVMIRITLRKSTCLPLWSVSLP